MSARSTALAAFLVLAAVSAARASADAPRAAVAGAPAVQSMIVGAGGRILSPARTVSSSATSLRIGARSCAVAAATPLATLAAVRRAGGPGFALRDYGRCGSSPVNSGQLFVYSLNGETNRGLNGWEYKVNGVAGTTGAGDPSGPRGNGRRLHAGDRLLWFWCQVSGGGCQRTLEVSGVPATLAAGQALSVSVTGFDNQGRGVPVAGAIVTLGPDFASTGANGRATLLAPSTRGRFQVSASRRGLVPSFPETIVVR